MPTLTAVVGHDHGQRISSHAQIVRYMEALAAANPTRMRVVPYGKTWEGRQLVYAVVASPRNLARLDAIKSALQRLRDPRRTAAADAQRLMADLPAVVWLGYGVHGNEISSPDAALLTAYHLLAARNDAMADAILKDVVVLIDPLQNPDGRDRFVRNFESAEGLEADPSPLAAEHNEPWPSGRTNHYQFDMNRDWFALTQPETRGRVAALLEWLPQVFVDLHEMGSDSTYYFAPEAVPYNPHLAKDQRESLDWFGRNNAKWFDQFGFSYFTREVYDAFYPGYGASWPSYYGAVAMTYEQASARGLLMRKSDDTVFSFRDTVRQHFVASLSTLETAGRNRERLLANFYRYQQTAIEEGSSEPVREYLLPRTGNVSNVDRLALILAEQGVEVKRATGPLTAGTRELPAGSYVIPMAQPAKRLIRTLLDPDVPMEADFLKEQERRRKRRLPDEIYDVTAWSLPLLFSVELATSATPTQGQFEAVKPGSPMPGRVIGSTASVAYLVPWGTSAAGRFLAGAWKAGLRVHSTDRGFSQNGRQFPSGTLIVLAKENPDSLAGTVRQLAESSGAEVVSTDTGWVEEGVNFGSRYVVTLRKPAIAMAWDRPTSPGGAGNARYVLERQFGMPVTAIRTPQLATADLSRFHVLILPDSSSGAEYANILGANGIRRLKDWVAAGGTLVGFGEATTFLADAKVGLLATARESVARPGLESKKTDPPAPDGRTPGKLLTSQEEFDKAIQPDSEPPDAVAGVLVRVKVDAEHWMGAGAGPTVHALVQGRTIFSPLKIDKGVNAAYLEGPDTLLASGYLWQENRRQLAYKPLVMVQREGRGNVIAFTADPTFRAYTDGMHVLLLNAVFRGPGHEGR